MAQVSKRLKRARRVKRDLTLHQRALDRLYDENLVYRQILTEMRVEQLKAQKAAEAAEPDRGSLIVEPSLKQIAQAQFGGDGRPKSNV